MAGVTGSIPVAPTIRRRQVPELQRFVTAQNPIMETVLNELRAGRKRTHWMWFVFPQLRGLGLSQTALFYGIESLGEAKAYFAHAILGKRLLACTQAVMNCPAQSLHDVFGSPDDMKFRSSLTLFEAAAPAEPLFGAALDKWCAGARDDRTLQLLAKPNV